jgi:hypothetical protein
MTKGGTPVVIYVDGNTRYFTINITPKIPLPDFTLKVPPPIKIPPINDNKITDKDIQRGLGAKKGQVETAKTPVPPVKGNIQNEKNNPKNSAMQKELANKKLQSQTAIIEDGETAGLVKQFTAAMESPKGLIDNITSLFGRVHKFGTNATFEDIKVDDWIVARLMPNEDLAKEVLIIWNVNCPHYTR